MKNKVINCTAFIILAALWLGFGAALVFHPNALDNIWQWFLGAPLVGQIVVALLTLPVVAGLWVWHAAWPEWLRLLLVIGLGFTTLYLFFPRKTAGEKAQTAPAKS